MAIIIDDFKSGGLGGRLAFLRVKLDEIRKPIAVLPDRIVQAAVNGWRVRVDAAGKGSFFRN